MSGIWRLFRVYSHSTLEPTQNTSLVSIFSRWHYEIGATLGTSILSASNLGNPALRLFGFGPFSPEGYGF
ncbi:hypothetical protein EDB92DRAFT_1898849 [Lactarius akahatsu]|uniref:Choline/carnitine acyltransferase domain-containing protein n=1 Tax=Lactarius akahatsu TaxID=416441 RepID=A0AAD4Q625_9AGAM|nr:hypothetical protein EDB92DRAFT_1898849 [Lactarius akahatsu]